MAAVPRSLPVSAVTLRRERTHGGGAARRARPVGAASIRAAAPAERGEEDRRSSGPQLQLLRGADQAGLRADLEPSLPGAVRRAPSHAGQSVPPTAVAGARVILPRPHRRPSPGRRVGTALLTLGALGALWAGAGAVRGAGPASSPHRIAGSVAVVGGFRYVVQPGDSLWAIATRVDPGGDPRALVDALSAELHGQMLQPGDVLVVP